MLIAVLESTFIVSLIVVFCTHFGCMLQRGTKAPQAAGRIHTDFERGFIMADVMKYDDFKAEGSEAAVRVRAEAFGLLTRIILK